MSSKDGSISHKLRPAVVTHQLPFLLSKHEHGVASVQRIKRKSTAGIFFAAVLQDGCKKKEPLLSASLAFINPIKLHISRSPHCKENMQICLFCCAKSKHSAYTAQRHACHASPFTPSHIHYAPTASSGRGLACKCFPRGSCRLRVLRPGDGSRWRLARNQYFISFLFFFCAYSPPAPPPF